MSDNTVTVDGVVYGPCSVRYFKERIEELERAAKATLLFHSGGWWDAEKQDEWQRLTGSTDATQKQLYDFIRAVLEKGKQPSAEEEK